MSELICAPLTLVKDAQGDLLRGLQVVETATGIPTAMLGNTIEGMFYVQPDSVYITHNAFSEQGHGYIDA